MRHVLAVDAGGTSTRAAVVRADGACLGFGRAGGGNPVSAGPEAALESVVLAARQAVAGPGQIPEFVVVLVAMAGMSAMVPVPWMTQRLEAVGVRGRLVLAPDLLAMFCSGTPDASGYALVAGTGSISARVVDVRQVRVGGGNGWLLGDVGSGFWIGHQVARAAVADLDGLGPSTTLTSALLGAVGLADRGPLVDGRPEPLVHLLELLYGLKPVQLARFAPLAFAAGDDEIATWIRGCAARALADLLQVVHSPSVDGPVVLGGSVVRAMLAAGPSPLADTLAGRATAVVDDGLVGATMLALREAGLAPAPEVFTRVTAEIALLRTTG